MHIANRASLVVLTYGVEAWNLARPLTVRAMRSADRIIAISAFTASQLMRSLDLLHVAAALELRAKSFLSFDTRQRQAARAEGLKILP